MNLNQKSKQGSEGDFEKKSIEFTYCDPEQAAIVHLKTIRDQKKSRSLGIDLGGEENEIAFVFQGDHGGDHMQFLQVNVAFEGCNQRFTTPLGSFKEKESYVIFANTILPHIDAGIGKLHAQKVVVIEWDGGFDFILVNRDEPVVSLQEITFAEDGTVQLHLANKIAEFDLKYIPKEIERLTIRSIPINCYIAGDLAYLFMLVGRMNHSTCKCIRCMCTSSKESYGQNCMEGDMWTLENMALQVANYKIAHASDDSPLLIGLSQEDIARIKAQSKEDSAKSGIKSYEALITNVAMENWKLPTLHIRLGIGNELAFILRDYIKDKLEVDLPFISEARDIRDSAKIVFEVAQSDFDTYVRDNEQAWKVGSLAISSYDKLIKNQQYVQLKETASRQALTTTQKANLDVFNERLFPVHKYSPGSEERIRAETFARAYKAESTRLKTAIATAKTKLKVADEIFEAKKRSRLHRPLEKEWEKMLSTFDIHFQQYYTMQLIGEHIHRLLKNSADICDKVFFIFMYIYIQ